MKLITTHHVRLAVHRPTSTEESFSLLNIVGLDRLFVEGVTDLVEQLLRFQVKRLITVHAEIQLSRRLLMAARTRNRRVRDLLIHADVLAVQAGVALLEGVRAEPRHVVRRVVAATHPTLAVFDLGLAEAETDEPARVRLPEVGRRRLLRDASTVGGLMEVVQERGIAHALGRGELTPQRRLSIVAGGMVRKPPLEIRRRLNQVDRPFTLFPVDVEPDGVLAVEDVADAEVVELAATEAGLELQHDQAGIPRVAALVRHRLDVLFVVEEIAFARDGIVVIRGAGRDPREGLGRLVELEVVPAERTEVLSVVLVRELVVVGAVYPADDRFCGVLVLEDVHEVDVVDAFAHDGGAAEDVSVSVAADVARDEMHVVAQLEECVAVDVAAGAVARLESVAEDVDFMHRVSVHELVVERCDCKHLARIPVLAYTKTPTITRGIGSYPANTSSPESGSYTTFRNSDHAQEVCA